MVSTKEHTTPDLPTGVDDLPDLVRSHPNRLVAVEDTPLEGAYEDYQNFVD